MSFARLSSLTVAVMLLLQVAAFAGVDEGQAIASAAAKLKSMNVCNLGNVAVEEIQSDMESFDEEEFQGLEEMARELNIKALNKHLAKYKFRQFYYVTYEPDECESETLIIQVHRDQGSSKGLILIGEDVKVRDL